MDGNRENEAVDRLRTHLAWGVRGTFLLAVGLAILWLFAGYRAPAPQAYPGREKVVFWHMWTGDHAKMVQRIVDRFNESQDRYEVISVTVAGGTLKTLIATAGGVPPDCMAQWDSVIPAWAERGALTPLDELMGPQEWQRLESQMYPAVKSIGMYEGHFYGLSVGMNIFAMYYRTDHFQEAGLDPAQFPRTLEELDRVAERLWRVRGGRIERIGFMPGRIQDWVAVFGGRLYDPQTRQLTLTEPRNVAALEWIARYAGQYDFERVQAFTASLPSNLSANWPFISGAYSITVDGQWRVDELRRFAPDMPYATAPIPYPEGGRPNAGWCNGNFMVIPSGARNKAGAWAFIRFWSGLDDPEQAAEFYTWGGWLPIMPSIAEAPAYEAYLEEHEPFRTFVEIMSSPNVQVTPPVPVQAFLVNRLNWAEEAAKRKRLSPAGALGQAEAEVNRELGLFFAAH